MSDRENESNGVGSGPAAEPETEVIPAAKRTPAVAKPPVGPRRIPPRSEMGQPQARPQRIEPQRIEAPLAQNRPASGSGRGRWSLALAGALVLMVAAGVAGYLYLAGDDESVSADAQIRTSIQSFTQALTTGDLAALRSGSCGELAAFYRDIPDTEFADVHRIAVEQGNIPVVENVDAVQITDDTAIAQVIAFTAANPRDKSPRTFDLRLDGEEWKVCSPE